MFKEFVCVVLIGDSSACTKMHYLVRLILAKQGIYFPSAFEIFFFFYEVGYNLELSEISNTSDLSLWMFFHTAYLLKITLIAAKGIHWPSLMAFVQRTPKNLG